MIRLSTKKKKKLNEPVFIITMMALPVLSFLVFWLYVNLDSILMAFQRPSYDGSGTFVWTFENFKMFFEDISNEGSVILPALKNTLIFFFSNILIVLPVSVFICYFMFKKIFMYRFFRFIFFLPAIIMPTVLVILFKYIVGAGGPLFALFESLRMEPIFLLKDSDYAMKTILFYTIFTAFGGNMVLLGGTMNSIDASIIEAGKIDGVGMTREIFQIIIPLIWPTLSTMVVLASVGIFISSGPILLFTKGENGTNTISYWIYSLVSGVNGKVDYEYASSVGLVFTAIGLPIVLIIKKLLNAVVADVEY